MQQPEKPQPRKTVSKDEQRYYGRRACLAIFDQRPGDIINIHLLQSRVRDFSHVLKWCAEKKKAYHICEAAELEKMAKTQHHEGVIILARKKSILREEPFLEIVQKDQPRNIIHLNGVDNPHNLGAMIRSASFFGLSMISIENPDGASLSSAAYRIAEGGAEDVTLGGCQTSTEHLRLLKSRGYRIVCLENHAKTDLSRLKNDVPTVFVLGAEDVGIAPAVLKMADLHVRISGNGLVTSLNVATAASIAFHHLACH